MGNVFIWAVVFAVGSHCMAAAYELNYEFRTVLEDELASLQAGRRVARQSPDPEDELIQDPDDELTPDEFDTPEGQPQARVKLPKPRHKHEKIFMKSKDCCGKLPKLDAESEKEMQEQVKPCLEEFQKDSGPQEGDPKSKRKEMKNRFNCLAECISKKTGTIDEDGRINVEKTKEFMSKLPMEEWMTKITNAAIDKCVKEVDETDTTKEDVCSQKALTFKFCIWKETMMSCPEEHQNKSRFCEKLRNRLKEKSSLYEETAD